MENFAKYSGWGFGNVQRRVPSAFELDYDVLVLSDLVIQSAYGIDVDLAIHSVFRLHQDSGKNQDALAYVDCDARL